MDGSQPQSMPTCLPAYLPTCLPAYLPTCLPHPHPPAYLPVVCADGWLTAPVPAYPTMHGPGGKLLATAKFRMSHILEAYRKAHLLTPRRQRPRHPTAPDTRLLAVQSSSMKNESSSVQHPYLGREHLIGHRMETSGTQSWSSQAVTARCGLVFYIFHKLVAAAGSEIRNI